MSNARLIVIAITLGHLISTSSQEELYSQQGARLVGKLCSVLTQFSSYKYRHLTIFLFRTKEGEKQEGDIQPLVKLFLMINDIVGGKWIVEHDFWLNPFKKNKKVRKKKFSHFWNGRQAPFSPWAGKRSG